jgi:cell division protein FtsA
VIGIGQRPSKGLRKGVIVDANGARDAIMAALEDAEVMAGVRIESAYVGISGSQAEEVTSEGSVEIRSREVTPRDVQIALDAARALLSQDDRTVLHVIPQAFTLDGEEGVSNPIGMVGGKLGVRARLITAGSAVLESLRQVLDLARVEVQEVVAQQLASAEAVLTEEEKEAGVALIDIGGGTSDIVVYRQGSPQHLCSVAVGGHHVTHDLSVGLRTPIAEAERIKKRYGCALLSMVNVEDLVEVPSIGMNEARAFPRKFLAEIIEPRVEEIFALALHQIQRSGLFPALSAGIVLTGGASAMPGMAQAAEGVFELPVRLGVPLNIAGLTDLVGHPMFATVVGLAQYGRERLLEADAAHGPSFGLDRLFHRMSAWLHELF